MGRRLSPPRPSAYPPWFPSLCPSSEDMIAARFGTAFIQRSLQHTSPTCLGIRHERLPQSLFQRRTPHDGDHFPPLRSPNGPGRDKLSPLTPSPAPTTFSVLRSRQCGGGCSFRLRGRIGPRREQFSFSPGRNDTKSSRGTSSRDRDRHIPGRGGRLLFRRFAHTVHHILSANLRVGRSHHGAGKGTRCRGVSAVDGTRVSMRTYHRWCGWEEQTRVEWTGDAILVQGAAGSRTDDDDDAWLSPRGGRSTRTSRYLGMSESM